MYLNDSLTQIANEIENLINLTPNTSSMITAELRRLAERYRRELESQVAKDENTLRDVRKMMDENIQIKREADERAQEISELKTRLETSQSEANLHYQLEDFIADWCRDNDCEPEDTQSLAAEIIDDRLDALFGELSEANRKAWGKKTKWSVDVKVTYTGTIEVEAIDEEDAREKAESMCADGEVDSDDLNYYEMEVEDVNED